MVDIDDGKASTITQSLLSVLRRCEIPVTSVFGFGSDGAAVMVGRRSGVATQLKEHNPEIVSLHCGAHRLALASSQAAQHVPYLKTFDAHLIITLKIVLCVRQLFMKYKKSWMSQSCT